MPILMPKTDACLAFGHGQHDDQKDEQVGQDALGRLA